MLSDEHFIWLTHKTKAIGKSNMDLCIEFEFNVGYHWALILCTLLLISI